MKTVLIVLGAVALAFALVACGVLAGAVLMRGVSAPMMSSQPAAGAGAPPPQSVAVGLRSFALVLPDGEAARDLPTRPQAQGVTADRHQEYEGATGFLFHDPDRNGVELVVVRTDRTGL